MAVVDGKIRCPNCGLSKELAEFNCRDQNRGSGYCRPCVVAAKQRWMDENREHDNARRREVYAAKRSPVAREALVAKRFDADETRRKVRRKSSVRYRLKSRYGISEAEYMRLVDAQGNCCAVCGATENTEGRLWCVDHDHSTGAIRGLLCTRCNVGIGALGDTAEGVRRALDYLERDRQQPTCTAPTMRINLLGAN